MWPDQDALNVVLGERRLALHPRWNSHEQPDAPAGRRRACSSRRERGGRARGPAIRHFEGPGANKPWHRRCAQPCREPYLEHRRETPWPRLRREGVTPLNVLRRLGGAARRPPRLSA